MLKPAERQPVPVGQYRGQHGPRRGLTSQRNDSTAQRRGRKLGQRWGLDTAVYESTIDADTASSREAAKRDDGLDFATANCSPGHVRPTYTPLSAAGQRTDG